MDTTATDLQITQSFIERNCYEICELLKRKNSLYGNAAKNPAMMFSQASPIEQIAVRCDDKIRRIKNMGGLAKVINAAKNADEDTVLDLIGYLILARVVFQQQEATDAEGQQNPRRQTKENDKARSHVVDRNLSPPFRDSRSSRSGRNDAKADVDD